MSEERDTIRQLGVQESPSDPMIYNRRQPDGTFRSLTGFFQREKNMTTEERETKTIAGKFAEALGCLEDAACHLRDIDKQYDVLYPDDECEYPEMEFWFALDVAIKPLEAIQKGLEAAEECMPKEKEI